MLNLLDIALENKPLNYKFPKTADDFYVDEEITKPGPGSFVIVHARKKNQTTEMLRKSMLRMLRELKLNYKTMNVNYAGKKDFHSISTQYFSIGPFTNESNSQVQEFILSLNKLPCEIIKILFHREKLKNGSNLGNHFRIDLNGFNPNDYEIIKKRMSIYEESGFLNFFGPQRFSKSENILKIYHALRNPASLNKRHFKDIKFDISAFQSLLFNYYLFYRNTLHGKKYLEGDRCKDFSNRTVIFEENKNLKEALITGPIFGSKMPNSFYASADLEEKILEDFRINRESFKIFGKAAKGSRRNIRVWPSKQEISLDDKKLRLNFYLPSGSYASLYFSYLTAQLNFNEISLNRA